MPFGRRVDAVAEPGRPQRTSGTETETAKAGACLRASVEATVQYGGWRLAVPPDVYEPAEDSFLLAEAARAVASGVCLDVGTGSGIVALALAAGGARRVIATDRNPSAVVAARRNAAANGLAVEVVRTDLAAGIRGLFDRVTFNPPYLPPEEERLPGELEHAFTGGPTGAESAVRLVLDLPRLLRPGGSALVVTSSRGGESGVLEAARGLGFLPRPLGEERWFFERLTAWELRRAQA